MIIFMWEKWKVPCQCVMSQCCIRRERCTAPDSTWRLRLNGEKCFKQSTGGEYNKTIKLIVLDEQTKYVGFAPIPYTPYTELPKIYETVNTFEHNVYFYTLVNNDHVFHCMFFYV